MTDERVGSWNFEIEMFNYKTEVLDSDLEHIANMIKQGFTSGDIIH